MFGKIGSFISLIIVARKVRSIFVQFVGKEEGIVRGVNILENLSSCKEEVSLWPVSFYFSRVYRNFLRRNKDFS